MSSYSADQTYTLEDLRTWDFPGPSLAVLGQPVRHSISPQMHNAALLRLSETSPELANWRYFRFEIDPEKIEESLPMFRERGFMGLNLTVPHKEVAFPLVSPIDEAARPIGAVNTLKRTDTGWAGFNTDGYGLAQGIESQLGKTLAGSRVVLLGAGGAARAAAIQALQSKCSSLTIVNRNQERLARLRAELEPIAKVQAVELTTVAPNDLSPLAKDSLLVNATSLGLKPDDPSPIPEKLIQQPLALYDMIYNPAETKLMRIVSAKGGKASNGLSMLVNQGARSLQIWTGLQPPVEVMQNAAENA